jgi:hypothetical protein
MLNWQRKKEQNFQIVFTFFGGEIGSFNPNETVIKGHSRDTFPGSLMIFSVT